jgi:hypothetical protein
MKTKGTNPMIFFSFFLGGPVTSGDWKPPIHFILECLTFFIFVFGEIFPHPPKKKYHHSLLIYGIYVTANTGV